MRRLGITYLRIDGQTDINTRNSRVQKFQNEPEAYSCMLLTTKVGGFGLNLTSADRVIILDPAWNPAVDMQAVDRAHRIGQEREVKTYRLVMSGLIEDKMFRLQVFKMGLTKTALETKQQQRLIDCTQACVCAYVGVDQKVLARSYVFGDHSSWLKSLRERSAMEFAKETYFFALDSWSHACALTYLQTPLPCR